MAASSINLSVEVPSCGTFFVNARAAARALGMSESWFWQAVRDGRMPKGIQFGVKATRWELAWGLEVARNLNQEQASA